MDHQLTADDFDCGDGVPDLPLLPADENGPDQPEGPRATIGATTAILALVIFGQLTLILAVLTGGDALVGAAAGIGLLGCGLILIGVRHLRTVAFGRP